MTSRAAWHGREFVLGRLCRTKRISSNLKGEDEDKNYNDDNDVCGNEGDLNKVESVVGSWMESQYATEQPGPQANMPIWPARYRPNIPIRGQIGEIFPNRLIT